MNFRRSILAPLRELLKEIAQRCENRTAAEIHGKSAGM